MAEAPQQQQSCPANPGQPCELVESARTGDVVCRFCGVVSDRIYDQTLEKRLFGEDGDEGRKRASKDDDLNPQLASFIGDTAWHNPGAPRKESAPSFASLPNRKLANQQTPKTKASQEAVTRLDEVCDQLRLTSGMRDTCRAIYKQYCDAREVQVKSQRGCRTDAILCAVAYLGCKRENNPRTLREISKVTGVSQRDIQAAYKALVKLLPASPMDRTNPAGLVDRICETLKLPYSVASNARTLTEWATSRFEGRQPASLAAAAVSMTCRGWNDLGCRRADKDIADAANISAGTVRTLCREIEQEYAAADAAAGTGSASAIASTTTTAAE